MNAVRPATAPGRHGAASRPTRGDKAFDALNVCLTLLMTVIFLYPLCNMVAISLSDGYAVLRAEVTFYPVGFDVGAYGLILRSAELWRAALNTAFTAIVGCALSLVMLCIAAYPLAFGNFYGKKLYTIFILFTMWFQGGIIPSFLTIIRLGLHDSLWALILNSLLSAYYIVIVRSNFSSIPASILESGRIDGANDYRILFQLVIPLSKPILATVALWVIVGHWNDYVYPQVFLASRDRYTLQLVLKEMALNAESSVYNLSATAAKTSGNAAALGQQVRNAVLVVSMLPMCVLYPFVQRFFVRGLMLGAVKG